MLKPELCDKDVADKSGSFFRVFGQILDILDKVGKIWQKKAGENNFLDAAALIAQLGFKSAMLLSYLSNVFPETNQIQIESTDPFEGIKNFFTAFDKGNVSFDNPEDRYQFAILLLRASGKY